MVKAGTPSASRASDMANSPRLFVKKVIPSLLSCSVDSELVESLLQID